MRIAAVDEDIAVIQKRQKLLDHVVDRIAGLDHHEHLAGLLQIVHQFFKAVAADDVLARGTATY